jgi:hypothetical protein
MERILTTSLFLILPSIYILQQQPIPIRQTTRMAPHTLPKTATTITLNAAMKRNEARNMAGECSIAEKHYACCMSIMAVQKRGGTGRGQTAI